MDIPLQKVLARLSKIRAQGSGWVASCPSHPDKNPSLSIKGTSDGKVLIWCHAECETDAIVKAIGLEMKDLFPSD